MKKAFARRSAGSLAASITIHVVVIAVLLQMVFRYPLGQLMGWEPELKPERLTYVTLPPRATQGSTARPSASPAKSSAPAALDAPTEVPTKIEAPTPADSSRSQAAGGTGSGFGVSGSGLATGIVPRQPDSRIELSPDGVARTPRTMAEDIDSIVNLAIGIYQDSLGIYARQRKPGDWTKTTKDGGKWGVDQQYIYVGKYKIPSVLLALLPLNKAGGGSPIEARSINYIRRDVLENAQRSISEDEFRTAVKRIRERKERERRQGQLASDSKTPPPIQP